MIEIRIPRLGWSMEEGTFVGWLKKPGDEVTVGEPLFELEGEKALQEIESVDAGRLHIPPESPQPGSVVPVGALLGYLLAAGESPESATSPVVTDNETGTCVVVEGVSGAEELDDACTLGDSTDVPHARPSVRRLARELGVDLRDVAGTGDFGQITADDVAAHALMRSGTIGKNGDRPGGRSGPVATPRAKRVASELGIEWTRLRGTGRDGRIREADVLEANAVAPRIASGLSAASGSLIPMTPRRKAISDRLRLSRERTIPVTLTSVADATNLVELRAQFQSARAAVVPAYTDLVACLVARVLRRLPQFAVRWDHDQKSLVPVAEGQIAIGVAVETSDGLLVPVIRDAARKPLLNVAAESKSLIEKARAGRLGSAEMQGGVFTVSNLGSFAVDAFTPIINYPEIAILGLGAIRREAVVLPDDRIVPRHRMTLSLTFDHAAIDGAPAAQLLHEIVASIETPAAQLLGD